jgi:hypothetical protein
MFQLYFSHHQDKLSKLFKFTAFPNGLSSCPRKFTKLFKPVLATLRVKGHILIIYIDDLLLVGHSYEKCVNTIIETLILLEKLGFVIHPVYPDDI